jgi:hypothetical protein
MNVDIEKKARELVTALQEASDNYLAECFPSLTKPVIEPRPGARRWYRIVMRRYGRDEELAMVDLETGRVERKGKVVGTVDAIGSLNLFNLLPYKVACHV